jgi:hypothetical protein
MVMKEVVLVHLPGKAEKKEENLCQEYQFPA